MKADLDTAFKGAAADALRANAQSFLTIAKAELGGQSEGEADPGSQGTGDQEDAGSAGSRAQESLDEQARAMEISPLPARTPR